MKLRVMVSPCEILLAYPHQETIFHAILLWQGRKHNVGVSVFVFFVDPSVDNVFAFGSVLVHNADLVSLIDLLSKWGYSRDMTIARIQ